METNRKFGLFTAICMIVGIVIGSGIFFKSDNVLIYTGGNVLLGVVVFIFAAIAIIFGSLSMGELATRTQKTGGIIAYAENYMGKKAAVVFGWYQNFIYYPSLIAVVSWVVGIYGCILFGINASLELQIFIGFMTYTLLFAMNYISGKLSGYFQNFSTVIKLIPILLIAVVGLFFSNPDFSILTQSNHFTGSSWIAAVGPIAFAYDGWIVATGLSHEIKNSKRNLPLALVIGPIFVLVMYLAYFVGISTLVGPQQIIALGDAHVDVAANMILGNLGSKVFLIFVIISVMGTSNGLILGNSRGFYALGVGKMIPGAKNLSTINRKLDTPTVATILSFVVACFWMLAHYITTKFSLLANSDVSEIAIVTMYLLYALLYIQVIRLKKQGEIKSVVRGYIIPTLAILGSLIIFFGGMQNPMFWLYAAFSAFVLLTAYLYANYRVL